MKIETRKLASVYDIQIEWEDRETFKLILKGDTKAGRSMHFEVILRFDYMPYFIRDLTKQWLESKRRRLAVIEDVDQWLPPREQS